MNLSNISNLSNELYADTDYCYGFVSGSCKKMSRPLKLQVWMFAFIGLAILVTIGGNLLVITAIVHFKQLHTSTNFLILSLAFCDFLLGAFIMPCSAVRSVQGCWYLGDFVCKLHTSTDIMLSACSVLHLSFISIDRYIAICTPLVYQSLNSSITTFLMVTTSWLISAFFAYGIIFSNLNLKGIKVWSHTLVFFDTQCVGGCTLFVSHMYAVLPSLIGFFIPGLIIMGIYIKIYKVARNQAEAIKDQTQQIKVEDKYRTRDSRKSNRRKENSLAIVVGVFFMCWTPFFLCTMIDPLISYSVSPTLVDTMYWFGYLNSGFNPLLYAFFYSWFRKALRIILSGRMFHSDSCRIKLYSD